MRQPNSSESPSRWIWPFELKERLGEGGMGVVYRARYVVNNREVAVKLLPDDVKNPVVLARFERELEVLKTLNHPNIVRSFGGVCEDKHRFYAMELIEGGSLEDLLHERGKLPWEQVIEYGRQMCAALAYLHQHGVVHRDLKPGNFLIGDDGQLKLSDFGLASVIAARRITTAGKTAGTILYMAPEQIRGGDVTPQTDLYALGCVIYELLAGTPPFVGSTPAATMHMHCNEVPPRVTRMALDCPVALEQIIQRLLAKNPTDRFADAVSVSRELMKVTKSVTVVPRTRPIDSDEFKLGAPDTPGNLESYFKETRAISHRPPPPRWPVLVAFVSVLLLGVWFGRSWRTTNASNDSEVLWVEAARSPDRTIRLYALGALGRLTAPSIDAVNAVAGHLSDNDPIARVAAASALGNFGAAARPHVGELHKIQLSDSDEQVRAAARHALKAIQADQTPQHLGWPAVLSAILLLLACVVVLAVRHHDRLLGNNPEVSIPTRTTFPR